jgi:S1-C subfamily serine protease
MNFIRQAFLSLGLLVAAAIPASAWDIDDMNFQIEHTNVIVGGVCSGTIIDVSERLVLTAHHCITDNLREVEKKEVDPITGVIKTTRVVERTPLYIETWKRHEFDIVSSQRHRAIIKGYDNTTDVAIIQVVDEDWKPIMKAPLANDSYKYKRGLPVYAVGNPGIAFDNSVTQGIISAPERSINFGTGVQIPLFQHSASTIGGNSGGAIYNDNGEIIGTLTGGLRGANISLAVPISYTKALLKRIGLEKVYQ